MSAKEWKEREADSMSRRRNLQDREFKRDFDAHYGKQKASGSAARNLGGAGKGDGSRPMDKTRYDVGLELTRKDLTDEQRRELEREWYALGGQQHPDDG